MTYKEGKMLKDENFQYRRDLHFQQAEYARQRDMVENIRKIVNPKTDDLPF